jgi:DNA polymerase I
MEIESDLPVDIQEGAFNILVAPEETAVRLLRICLGRGRSVSLYVCGNYSRLLSRLNLRNVEFDVRRAFTSSQLLSILEETRHTFVFIEHDPTLYAESEGSAAYVSLALRELSRESTVLLHSVAFDEHLRIVAERADRVFCLEKVATHVRPRLRREVGMRMRHGRMPDGQSTLEGF